MSGDDLALAIYSQNNPYFDERKLEHRMIEIDGHRINVRQAWKPDGRGGTEIGFGAVVYPSAIVLAHELADLSLSGKRIIELGCGHGFASVAAGKLGAGEVICTDGDLEVLETLTIENVKTNGVSDNVRVKQLLWGDKEMEQALEPPFDIVIASDVAALVYEDAFTALVSSLLAMSSKESLIIIAYEKRHGIERKFFHKLAKFFTWTERKPSHPDFKDVHNLFVLLLERK